MPNSLYPDSMARRTPCNPFAGYRKKRRRCQQDFPHRQTPPLAGPDQDLAEDGLQRRGQDVPGAQLFRRGKHVDEPLDGLGRVGCVERAEDNVPGFCSSQRDVRVS